VTSKPARFRPALRVLHWIMAVAVVLQLLAGLWLAHSVSPARSWLLTTHETVGFLILLLVPLRVLLRLTRPAPSLALHLPRVEAVAANAANLALYVLMLTLPLTGLAMMSAAKYPIVIFGSVRLPNMLAQNLQAHALLRSAHTWLALALMATFLAHLLGVLQHAIVRRDRILSMMAGGVSIVGQPARGQQHRGHGRGAHAPGRPDSEVPSRSGRSERYRDRRRDWQRLGRRAER
jgi:cytochrome b561